VVNHLPPVSHQMPSEYLDISKESGIGLINIAAGSYFSALVEKK
jgi:hypothetical protein